jgi:elongation factor P
MVMVYSGEPWLVVEFQHVKPGKGNAFVRTRIKNLTSGRVQDVTFRSGEKLEEIRVERRRMQFLYRAGDLFHMMDQETYDQITVSAEVVGDGARFIRENEELYVAMSGDRVYIVEPPMFVELKIAETEPGVRGDTATGATKNATMETGLVVQVPLFLEKGDVLKIDTRDARYVERVSRKS